MKRTPSEVRDETAALFGTRLREVRLALGVTQGELARRARTSRQALVRAETGRRAPCPMLDTAVRYAAALGVPLSHLLCVFDPVR